MSETITIQRVPGPNGPPVASPSPRLWRHRPFAGWPAAPLRRRSGFGCDISDPSIPVARKEVARKGLEPLTPGASGQEGLATLVSVVSLGPERVVASSSLTNVLTRSVDPKPPTKHVQQVLQPPSASNGGSASWTAAGPEDIEIVDYH
jgi:hypothetical protein